MPPPMPSRCGTGVDGLGRRAGVRSATVALAAGGVSAAVFSGIAFTASPAAARTCSGGLPFTTRPIDTWTKPIPSGADGHSTRTQLPSSRVTGSCAPRAV